VAQRTSSHFGDGQLYSSCGLSKIIK
jgi:hypothetical protein